MSFEMCNFDPAEENGLIASTREVYSGGKRNFQPRYLSRKCTIMSALDGAKAVERHRPSSATIFEKWTRPSAECSSRRE